MVGFEGVYSVSSDGRIRRDKPWGYRKAGHTLKAEVTEGNYLRVTLYNKPTRIHVMVHVLVAAAFIGENEHGYEVNHKDGNKWNNSVDNLEYATRQQNTEHKVRFRLHAYGARNGMAKLNAAKVRKIKLAFQAEKKPTFASVARKHGVSPTTISALVKRRSWKHLDALPF